MDILVLAEQDSSRQLTAALTAVGRLARDVRVDSYCLRLCVQKLQESQVGVWLSVGK